MGHPIRRLVATAAGGAAAAIIGSSIAAPAAATTVVPGDAEQHVRVELHSLEPATPAPGDQVEITGSITNVTDEPLHNVQALLRYDSRPLATRSDIARVTTEADVHWGWRPGHIYDIARDELAPGESARFDLEFVVDNACLVAEPASMPCLGLPAEGVYAIGVDGNVTTAEDERHTGGTARTVVPWQIDDADPVPVALLWPIIDAPQISDGALDALDDIAGPAAPDATPSPGDAPTGAAVPGDRNPAESAQELAPLLTAPDDAPVTWAVDPDTWSPAVAGVVGDAGELMVLPPSVPDAGALARVDPGLAGAVAAEAGRRQQEFTPAGLASAPARTDAAWPGAGTVTAEALHAWADAGYDTVVLPRDAVAMPDRSPTASIEVGGTRLSAILTDAGLDSAIADNIRPDEKSAQSAALDLRQRWLAETALARDEPFRTGSAALVAAPPAGWRPSPEVAEAVLDVWTGTDWITPTGISGVTATPPPRRDITPAAVLSPLFTGTDGLPGDYVREVRQLHDQLARYHSLLGDTGGTSAESDDTGDSTAATPSADPGDTSSATAPPSVDPAGDPDGTRSPATTAPSGGPTTADGSGDRDDVGRTATAPALTAARAASVAWHDDLDTARAEVAALRRDVGDALSGVSVVVNPSNTLSGNTGVFPVNIANELAHAVTVRLEFDPANEDRLAIEPVEARVPGGQQQTVQVRAEAVANGEVPVSVQLATVDGVPLGGAQHTIVNATHYGTIGWFVVGGSALLFAGGLSWRMLRGRRRTGR